MEDKKIDPIEGKDSAKNPQMRPGRKLRWGLSEPTDNEAADDIDPKLLSKNKKRLYAKFDAEEPFFILGKAGWGKTKIIEDMAEKFDRKILTVYLDKARAEDLEGTPIANIDKDNKAKILKALPDFAQIMYENPDQDFLLFFDEMNQAQPDVMNALMPIVLETTISGIEFTNFIVGAAGNFEDENDAVNELSDPLRQRFMPIITWETNTESSWEDSFKYLHKKWDDKLSKEFVDVIEENAMLFPSPRVVEHKIFEFCYIRKQRLEKRGKEDYMDSSDYLDRLKELINKDLDLSRSQEKNLEVIADFISDYMHDSGSKSRGRSRSKGADQVSEDIKQAIKDGMKFGYIKDGDVKYGVSKENIYDCFDTNEVNREIIDRIIRKYEAENITFKFDKDEQWKKAGYEDPNS